MSSAQPARSHEEYQLIRSREALARHYYDRDDGLALEPHTICLSVNSNCFMHCKMCDIGTRNATGGGAGGYFQQRYGKAPAYSEFPLSRIKELVEEVKPYQPIIKTNFVEPLLYKGLPEAASYIKQAGLKFYTITNGWTLKRHAPWLCELPADLIRVSLDGSPEVHDLIRGKRGAWQKAVEGIEAIVALKKGERDAAPLLGVCYTISNYNFFNLMEFMHCLQRRGLLDQLYVNFNHLLYTTDWEVAQTKGESPMFGHLNRCSMDNISFEELKVDVLRQQIELLTEHFDSDRYHYYFSPWLKGEDLQDYYNPNRWMFPRTPCRLPWYSAQVEMSGDVGIYGHCILPSFGNIFEQGFLEVWNSPRAQDIRRQLKEAGSFPACNKCIGTLYPLRGRV